MLQSVLESEGTVFVYLGQELPYKFLSTKYITPMLIFDIPL